MKITLRDFMKIAKAQSRIEVYDFDDMDYISRDFQKEPDRHEAYGDCVVVSVEALIRGDDSGGAQSVLLVKVQKPDDFWKKD